MLRTLLVVAAPCSLPFVALSVLIAASVVAGCSAPEVSDAPASAPPAPATSSVPAPPADEPPGTIACGKAVDAVRESTLMNPGVVTDITNAAATADAPVADAARALSEAYTEAVAAHGTDNEPDAVAAVSATAAELVSICADSGLETVG